MAWGGVCPEGTTTPQDRTLKASMSRAAMLKFRMKVFDIFIFSVAPILQLCGCLLLVLYKRDDSNACIVGVSLRELPVLLANAT